MSDTKFDSLFDIDKMFAEAAGAAENTGEKDPEVYSKDGKKSTKPTEDKIDIKKDKIEKAVKPEPKKEKEVKVEEPKVNKEVEKTEPKSETKKEKIGPIITRTSTINIKEINVDSITRIIEMKQILDSYNKTELNFIKGYFQNESEDPAEVIYEALTANKRGLDALNKIVVARGYTAAERAFYLMELDHNSLEAICEQVELLTGELEKRERVNENNKIKVCRLLEGLISNMDDSVFTYINKLQEFTNKAIYA